jgi:hypothetical protein
MDGNFTAEHLKMANPEDDVRLRDGAGFLATDQPYKDHLAVAIEIKEVGPLSEFSRSATERIEDKIMS